jgi:hypothetical protein
MTDRITQQPAFVDFAGIHKSASQCAREAYSKEYGVDYHDDPKWEIGGERHEFWLKAFDAAQTSEIMNDSSVHRYH